MQPETNSEQAPEMLYEYFQDTEVTVFGMTGTIGELSRVCPVPAEQRTPEAMNRFTAKVLQASGIEIPEQFAVAAGLNQAAERQVQENRSPVTTERPTPAHKPAKRLNTDIDQALLDRRLVNMIEPEKEIHVINPINPATAPLINKPPATSLEPALKAKEKPRLSKAAPSQDLPKLLKKTAERQTLKNSQPPLAPETVSKTTKEKNLEIPVKAPLVPKAKPPQVKIIEKIPNHHIAPVRKAASKPMAISHVSKPAPAKPAALQPAKPLVAKPREVVAARMSISEHEVVSARFNESIKEPSAPVEIHSEFPEESQLENAQAETEDLLGIDIPVSETALSAEEILDTALPISIQEKIAEFSETAEPEAAIIVTNLVTLLGSAITQLEELQNTELIDEDEITKVQEAVMEVYDELLQSIGTENKEERLVLVNKFITELRTWAQKATAKNEAAFIEEDEGTHEYKRGLSEPDWIQFLPSMLHQMLGRFTISRA